MNRRGFLIGMLAAGAAPAIVKAANLMPIFVRRESGLFVPQGLDLIREASAYDISAHRMLARWDILVGTQQFGIDMQFTDWAEFNRSKELSRKMARDLLDRTVRESGLSLGDARPLPPLLDFAEGT